MTLSIAVNPTATIKLFIDGDLKIDLQPNTRSADTVICSEKDVYYEINYVTGKNEKTGCCIGKYGEYLLNYTYP
jgi:hypothetical protein